MPKIIWLDHPSPMPAHRVRDAVAPNPYQVPAPAGAGLAPYQGFGDFVSGIYDAAFYGMQEHRDVLHEAGKVKVK